MLKHWIILLFPLLALYSSGFAQTSFVDHSISNSHAGPWAVAVADINNDDCLDLAVASSNNIVTWWENNGKAWI